MGLSFIEEVALPSPKSSPPIADQLLSHRVVLLEEQLLQDALASLVFFQARLELVHADILPERRKEGFNVIVYFFLIGRIILCYCVLNFVLSITNPIVKDKLYVPNLGIS